MKFNGRTVVAFILLAMVASSILTLTVVSSTDLAQLFSRGTALSNGANGSNQASGMTKEDIQKLVTTYDLIRTNFVHEVEHDTLINGAITGMIASLDDPYTTYMDPEEVQQFDETLNSSFQGIGAEVSSVNGKVTITAPIKDSPAEKAGLLPNDVILSINGESLDGLTLTQAVTKIRGPKGTEAVLSILRPNVSEPIEITIVRDDIPLETVFAEMVTPTIGKVIISQFANNTAEHFANELAKLEQQGMKALIIDVRNDPGGVLQSVLQITEHFVKKDTPILQMESRDGSKRPQLASGQFDVRTYPVAVLTNKGSASASEILAAALQENSRAEVFGETTFGKGTVQVPFDKEMGDGSSIKMTILKWLTPNGNWIHQKGVEPDVVVEQPEYYKSAPFTRKEPVLSVDMNGEDVKTLQLMLGAIGLQPDRQDGYFSNGTMEQVKVFQRRVDLPDNGKVDEAVMNALEKALIDKIKDPSSDLQLQAAVKHLEDKID